VYVQHLIEEQGEHLWTLLQAGGHVYVCGATKMGHDVMKAFEAVAAARGKLAPPAAAAYVNDLKAKKRYIQELWTS
jgi:sulfite reductase (NADPH) flavoprotein alpha-component